MQPPPYNSTCPQDKPLGQTRDGGVPTNKTATAEPFCMLRQGAKYFCALECGSNLVRGNATCPLDSQCIPVPGKVGESICTFFF